MYKSARYIKVDGKNAFIRVNINGVESFVPLDPENSDYAEIMRFVAAGRMGVEEAEEPVK